MSDLDVLRSLVVKRLGYSRNPWRAVTPDGQETHAMVTFDHPDLGPTRITEPVMGRTKRECVARLAALIAEHEEVSS